MRSLFKYVLLALAVVGCSSSDVKLPHRMGAASVVMPGTHVVDFGSGNMMFLDTTGALNLALRDQNGNALAPTQQASAATATTSSAGLMTAAQASTLTNTTGGLADVTYTSVAVDLTQTGATQIVPAAPAGFVFVPIRQLMVVSTESGTYTGAPSVQIGNNSPTFNNVLTSSAIFPSTAIANLGAGSQTNGAIPSYVQTGSAYSVNVTVGATGGTSLTARYTLVGYWHPLP